MSPRYRIGGDGRMVPVTAGPAHLQPHRRFRSSARWQRARAAQIARQPWCSDCGHTGSRDNPLSADHVVPTSAGGAQFPGADGLQTLCARCNASKGAM